MNILVIGTGYVGLVTGACFAELGHQVTCLDTNEVKIQLLKQNIIPIFEPSLDLLVRENQTAGRLCFTSNYAEAIPKASFCFLALPTPAKEDGSANLDYIKECLSHIAIHMQGYLLIVNKSTVPVGTKQWVKETLQKELDKHNKEFPFHVVSNPEFLKEGAAVQDFMHPDRVIIGSDDQEAINQMRELYQRHSIPSEKILIMDAKSAELTKYAANAMLATRISFMNEISGLCEELGADINAIRLGIGSDRRIGHDFLYAGIGYGGSCFPKDLKALAFAARQHDYAMPILHAVESINARQKELLKRKIEEYFISRGGLQNKTIAVWGLSFKPNTDDIREAPAFILIESLLEQGVKVRLYDPVAMPNAKTQLGNHALITWCENEYIAAKNADAIALLTEWKQFGNIDFLKIRKEMKNLAMFDGRNQYNLLSMQENGFDYFGIGVPSTKTTIMQCT